MTAIAGCYWRNARPARIEDLRPSTDAAAHRAQGPFTFHCSGPVAVAYGGHRAGQPSQPFHDASSRLTVIVDGRIDNLDDVAGALDFGAERNPSTIALAAYRRWGAALGVHLLGDFVIVIHDESANRVFGIRDAIGHRPLFFGTCPAGIVFGSEAQQIVRHPAMQTGINEAMVAEYLADMPSTVAETLWLNVYRVPPAHFLELTPDAARVQRYWDFDPGHRDACADSGDYTDRFRELFTQAVECRVRGVDSVGVFLSGGLDSSSVTGVAQATRSTCARSSVRAFSTVFPGQPCDESAFIDAVTEKWGIESTRMEMVHASREGLRQQASRYLDVPLDPNSLAADALRRKAHADGIEVLLTGRGGDDFLSGAPLNVIDLLRQGRFLACGRAMVNPFLSDRARRLLRPIFGARPFRGSWIRPDFARRVGLEDRLRARATSPFETREQRELHGGFTSLLQMLGDELEDRAAHASGVEQRHPFYDRRVMEFALALPPSERWKGREHKVVVRRALADVLPPLVLNRSDKADFSPTHVEALEAMGGARLFTHMRSEEAGWVDGAAIRGMYDRMQGLYSQRDEAYIALTGPLLAVLAIEIWLECAGETRTIS